VDDSATTRKNRGTSVAVLANDSDPDGRPNRASVRIVQDAAHGTAVAKAGGTVTYTPAGGFVGFDEFRYAFLDNAGNASNVAKVRVLVK
jgi:hypothetical protein